MSYNPRTLRRPILVASGVLVCGGPGPATAHRRCGLAFSLC